MKGQKEWFEEWFDSPYYPILYQNRNDEEAEKFLTKLIQFLNITANQNIIDLACGRGRHSIFLNKKGYQVTGVDLSVQSILHAKKLENKNLHFKVADLRYLKMEENFNIALNLFTSFGYFDCLDTNIKVLSNIYNLLEPNGLLVIDFFNLESTLKNLVGHEEKTVNGVNFTINKNVQSGNIVKQILVQDNEQKFTFYEKVQALSLHDFETCLTKANFKITKTFGNYELAEFNLANSNRLIIIAVKC